MESLRAQLAELERKMKEETQTTTEKKKEAKEDQKKLFENDKSNNTGRSIGGALLAKL